jgi:hypothetical protein
VLSSFNDDYLDDRFFAEIDLDVVLSQGRAISVIRYDLSLQSNFLNYQVLAGKATLALDVYSKQTLYRSTVIVPANGEIRYMGGELFGTVEVTPYLLNQEANDYFKPLGVHAEYRDATFSVAKGDVLAIGETFEFEVVPDVQSLPDLMTVELASEFKTTEYDFELDRSAILIRVGRDVMRYWEMASADSQIKPNLFQGIYKDCILFALSEIAAGGHDDSLWAKALKSRALENGFEISKEMDLSELNKVALSLVAGNGISKLLKNAGA